MKYFKHAEKTWRKVYKDKETMRGIYGGFETWLNKYGCGACLGGSKSKVTTLTSS